MASWFSLRTTLAALLVASAGLFAIGVAIERSQPHHSAAREAAERAAEAPPAAAPVVTAPIGGETTTAGVRAATSATRTERHAERTGESGTATATTKPAERSREAGESPAQRAREGHAATKPKTTKRSAATPSSGEGPAERASEGGTASSTTTAAPRAGAGGETHSERVLGLNPDAAWLVIVAVAASLLLAFGVWRFPRLRPLLVLVALTALASCAFDVKEAVHQFGESRTSLVVIAALVAALHLAAAAVALAMVRRTTTGSGPTRPQVA